MTKARKTQKTTDGSLSTHNGFSLISNEKLLEIYSMMLKCRMLEERLHSLGREGQSSLAHGSVHVAAIAGAAIDLKRGDTLAPSPGAITPCLAKRVPLDAIFASLNGQAGGPSFSSRNLIRPALSAEKQIERGMKAAIRCRAERNSKVVAVFSSDASGAALELELAMKLAGKKKLPILFVHETNSESDEPILRATEFGFPGVAVEDDDAVAIYRVTTEALAHARRGNGPTLILCRPWPLSEKGKGRRRHAMHPIRKMEEYLASKGLFSRKYKTKVVAEFGLELDQAANKLI
jgi:TPP-dependent pyruvate/acetoin dehydrogenase alpha subunit